MNLEEHAEDLASDLGVDKEEVKSDLENLVAYSVPVEEAKSSLRRKYGGGGGGGGGPTTVDLEEVSPDSGNVNVTVRVLTVGKRPIRYRGEDHLIFEGEVADGTGQLSYTAWEDFGLSPGDTITAGNANVREWDGHAELNFGESTSVEFLEEPLSVDSPIGGDRDLADVEPGDRGRNVEATVVEVEEKTIDGRDGETAILSGVLADETARVPFTDWEPRPEVEEGASLALENVYVREFRGIPSVNLSEYTTVRRLDRAVEAAGPTALTIREALERGGQYDVEVVGSVIEVRDGSGLIQRCPECGRVVEKGQCRTHGQVDGEDDLRVKAILDDGGGTVTVILDDDLTAEVYGGDLDAAREQAREAMDHEVVADTIRERIVGREYRVRGDLSVDDFGANLDAKTFDRTAGDPADRARDLLREVAG